jgi:threonine dehydratase
LALFYAGRVTAEVTRDDIVAAAGRIEGHVRRTPMIDLGDVHGAGYTLSLKLDNLQRTGSFKVRGAFSLMTSVEIPEAGVVAASGGNFGLAVACAARDLGYRATIFVPETSPREKIGRIAEYGVDVRLVPGFYADALDAATEWADETGAYQAHAYDDKNVVAGQGTCAAEILHDSPNLNTVLVAVGGGGLIAGIASWIRSDAGVVAIEPESCPTLYEARRAGEPVEVEVGGIAASALGASRIGDLAWYANQWIDDAVLVTDSQIVEAQKWLWESCRLVVEPAAATTLAALASGAYFPERGERIVAVISGANTNPGSVV